MEPLRQVGQMWGHGRTGSPATTTSLPLSPVVMSRLVHEPDR